MSLTPKTAEVLAALRHAAEGPLEAGWRDVYLDNAGAQGKTGLGLSRAQFAGHLSALEAAGLYKVVDGFAWGRVNMGEVV
jgi:hypothetical protein